MIRKRIDDIIALRTERQFVPGLLLGMYAMIMLSLIMANMTVAIFDDWNLDPYKGLITIYWFIVGTLTFGKLVIICHIQMFNLLSKITQGIINKSTMRYYKKHKKDPPTLDKFSKYQYKIFGWWWRFNPELRKKMLICIVLCWFCYAIFARTELAEWFADIIIVMSQVIIWDTLNTNRT